MEAVEAYCRSLNGLGKDGEVIDDPWYGGGEGFEVAYRQCVRFSKGLLREILGENVD